MNRLFAQLVLAVALFIIGSQARGATYEEMLQEARGHFGSKRYQEALEGAKRLIAADKTRFEGHALTALILVDLNRGAEAKAAIAEARRLAPADKQGPLVNLEAAVDSIPKAIPGSPMSPEQRRRFNVLDLVLEEADRASNPEARKKLLEEFLNGSAKYLSDYPDDPRAWVLQGRVCLELNRTDDGILAARALQRLKVVDSEDPTISRLIAQIDRKGWLTSKTTAEIEAQKVAEAHAQKLAALARVENDRIKAAAVPLVPFDQQDFTVQSLGAKLIAIKPGYFFQGDLPEDPAKVTGRYAVITRGFWLGQTEVTEAQWQSVMGTTARQQARKGGGGWWKAGGENHPMTWVSWSEAMEFCRKLTERERKAKRLPVGYEYTLPTEAQWEYACRSGTTGDYAGTLEELGWFDKNSGGATHPVGQKRANAWGLHDMHGNVWEWCQDWYGEYAGGTVVDFAGASSGSNRVDRGGGWFSPAASCRSALRGGFGPGNRYFSLGFRLALSSVQ